MTAPAAAKVAEKKASNKAAKSAVASGSGSPEKKVSTSDGAPEKKPAAQRASETTKDAARKRVESAKQSHKRTALAVEGKKRKERVLSIAEMRPKTRMLAAEFIGAIVIAIIMLFLQDGEKNYHQRMSRFFVQMTGITGIFFVLSLVSSSQKAARYAVPFGLLIDVSMLIYLFKQGGGKVIDALTGNATTDYAEIIHNEETAHGTPPTLIAPGLIVTPGNVDVYGGKLGGPVRDPGLIITPGNSGVLTPNSAPNQPRHHSQHLIPNSGGNN